MKNNILLFAIVLFSLLIRLLYLGENPRILNRDEAAIGYNAFLLQQSGRDEWGKSWPLTLESFGDYKLIGYPFFVASLFNFLPATDFVVRLPSALFGSALIIGVYLLTLRINKNKSIAILAAYLTAVTPIFFFYSRIAFEANVALFFFIMYLYFLLREVDKKTVIFDCIALFFALLAVLTYNTPLLLLPFIIFLIPLIRGIKHWKSWLFVFSGSLLLIFLLFSIFASLTTQKQGITIFADSAITLAYSDYRASFSGVFQTVLGNKYLYYFKLSLANFFKSFSPEFLVIKGGEHPWHTLPGWGHLLLPLYFTSLSGIIYALVTFFSFFKKLKIKTIFESKLLESKSAPQFLLLYFLIISLAPSVITVDSPHATRSLFFIVILVIFSAVAVDASSRFSKFSRILSLGILVSCSFLFSSYLNDYFSKYPQQQTEILRTGFAATLQEIDQKHSEEKIAVVDTSGYQYILLAWYLKIPPQEFFDTVIKQQPDRIGFRYGEKVGRYHFVAKALDRSQDEKYVVEWKENTWKSTEY